MLLTGDRLSNYMCLLFISTLANRLVQTAKKPRIVEQSESTNEYICVVVALEMCFIVVYNLARIYQFCN